MALRQDEDIWLCLPVPPLTNTRLKAGRHGKLYRDRKNTEYQKLVQAECMVEKVRPLDGDVLMSITWYRKHKRGDIDRFKDLQDALQGYAYHDDKQIKELRIKRTDKDPGNPHIVVNVKTWSGD